jgi:hypothetical protein
MSKSIRIPYQKDGKECAVIVKKPTHSQLTEANLYAAAIFNKARKTGVCLRSQIDDWLEEQNIWTKDDRQKIKELEESLNNKIERLSTGKNEDDTNMKLSEARKLAIDIRTDRWRLNLLALQRRSYDEYSVEGQTENARFDCLASLCILDEEGNRLFKSVDDYYDLSDEQYITQAASKLANMMFGTEDWEMKLPENEFLVKHKLVDDKLRLVNKDGKFVDSNGTILTEEQVKEEGQNEVQFEDDTQ